MEDVHTRNWARGMLGKSTTLYAMAMQQSLSRIHRPHTPPPVVFFDDYADIETRMLAQIALKSGAGIGINFGRFNSPKVYQASDRLFFGWDVNYRDLKDIPSRPDWLDLPFQARSMSDLLKTTARIDPYTPPAPPAPRPLVLPEAPERPRTGWQARKKEVKPLKSLFSNRDRVFVDYDNDSVLNVSLRRDEDKVLRWVDKYMKEQTYKALYQGLPPFPSKPIKRD